MLLRLLPFLLVTVMSSASAQREMSVVEDLRDRWMRYDEQQGYRSVEEMPFGGLNTVYFQLDPSSHRSDYLFITSAKPWFLFVDGKVAGEFEGTKVFRIDSLLRSGHRTSWIAVHQTKINERDLLTRIIGQRKRQADADSSAPALRPYSHFRDFVVAAGLLIILLFLVTMRLNPKLASDYFSMRNILSARESDDSQASARLTSGSNVQFYAMCSLLLGFYLLIVFQNLPARYALPGRFSGSGFWSLWFQWLKLSGIVFLALALKIVIIYSVTRLFGMRGMARYHFFNWIRLLLVVIGVATVFLFIYFIGRGDRPELYAAFLWTIVAVLVAWIAIALFKLSDRSGHSMFHLFSYLCATEIIPLLITVKVLFQ